MAQHGYRRDDEDFNRGDDRERRRDEDQDRSFMFGGGDERERALRNFRSHQDDHYLSWRDKQMEALDRDYADYCREREQQFHQDFDAWRRQRQANPERLQTGMTQTGQPGDTTLELTSEDALEPQYEPNPMEAATLGTTSGGRDRS